MSQGPCPAWGAGVGAGAGAGAGAGEGAGAGAGEGAGAGAGAGEGAGEAGEPPPPPPQPATRLAARIKRQNSLLLHAFMMVSEILMWRYMGVEMMGGTEDGWRHIPAGRTI